MRDPSLILMGFQQQGQQGHREQVQRGGRLRRSRFARLLVVDGENLVGTLTLADLLRGITPRPS